MYLILTYCRLHVHNPLILKISGEPGDNLCNVKVWNMGTLIARWYRLRCEG